MTSLLFGRELGKWAIVAGPVLHIYSEAELDSEAVSLRRPIDLVALAAIRRRL
jgi:hypothetical protein